MSDTGSGAIVIIYPSTIKRLKLSLIPLTVLCILKDADGENITEVHEVTYLILKISRHIKEVYAFVTKITHFDIILSKL